MPALGSNQDYLTRLPVFLDGVPLTEVTSVELTLDSGRTEVFTTTKGLAGFAEGAKMVTAKINLAVPISGQEVDVWKLANTGDYCTLQVGIGKVDFASTGKVINCNVSGSVNNAIEESFEWRGPAKVLE